MEITPLYQEIREHFVKGLSLVIKAIKIKEGEPDADIYSIASALISDYHENILPYFKIDLNTVFTMHKELLDVPVLPIGTTATTVIEEIVVHSRFFLPNAGNI